jgi:hypothetical protein
MRPPNDDLCTFVNALCPSDTCVLPYGHPFTSRHRHLTGTMYGSYDTSYEEQVDLLRRDDYATWHKDMHYLAPRGTLEPELVRLGWELQRKLRRRGKVT